MNYDPLSERAGQAGSTNHIVEATLAELAVSSYQNGAQGFATDGRKDGEGAGSGTGIPVWYDETSATWRTYTTGAAATA